MVYDPKKYVSTSQAAKICSVSRVTVHNWIKSGKLPALKLPGGQLKISRDDLDIFITQNYQMVDNSNETKEQRIRVVIVDDDPKICSLLNEYLSESMNIDTFNSVLEATSQLDTLNPDVILLDMMMPGVEGSIMATFLQKSEKHHSIPIIFMSALPENEVLTIMRTLPAHKEVDFIPKPFRLESVKKLIQHKCSE